MSHFSSYKWRYCETKLTSFWSWAKFVVSNGQFQAIIGAFTFSLNSTLLKTRSPFISPPPPSPSWCPYLWGLTVFLFVFLKRRIIVYVNFVGLYIYHISEWTDCKLYIVVAKKYISTCRNCSSVGCLKCVQFHNWFWLH